MNIYALKGHKVTVTEKTIKNGYDSVEEHAREHLVVGEVYTVDHTIVDGWSTTVVLQEFTDETFDSVSFEDVEGQPEGDPANHPDFRRYNG